MMSLNELDDLVRHVEARNLAKCVERGATPYRVAAGGLAIEIWDGLDETWGVMQTFDSKAARERWERSGETRDSFVPHNGLAALAGKPWHAKVVRLQAVQGGIYAIKLAPMWRHEGMVGGKLLYARLMELADDRHTIIDHSAATLAAMLAEAFGAPQTAVVAADQAAAPAPVADEAEAARQVSEGWRRAQGGLVEIIRFGAALLAVAERLEAAGSGSAAEGRDTGRGGDRRSGTGLKGWLAERCPEVNYKTAYGYMCAAAGLRREARLAADVPLLAMMGEDPVPEARAEKLRQRVHKILADSTLRLLRDAAAAPAAPKGGARDGAGRPKAQQTDAETAAGAAWAKIGREIDRAAAWRFERFLPEAIAREALETVTALRDALKERIAETAAARKGGA